MSYDLTIAKDQRFSGWAKLTEARELLCGIPGVKTSGERGFAFEPRSARHMEIDLEVVSSEGDNIEQADADYSEVNCIRLHIPYSMLGAAPQDDYFPVAFTIAEGLGWTVFDDQSGQSISREIDRPWWKFW